MTKKRGKTVKSKKIKFSNKLLYALIVIGILVLVAIGIYAAILTLIDIGHPEEEIIVSIDNCNVTLADAISNEWLKGLSTSTLTSSNCLLESEFPKTYHLASEIIVEINSIQLTLQDAINQNYFKGTGTISSALTSLPSIGHFATKVEVTIGGTPKILQEALSELKHTCVANYNQDCPSGDAACINLGKIQCDGTCSGSYKSSGTSCGTDMECDGSGYCVGLCNRDYGLDCSNACIIAGIVACDGTCIGTFVSKGTSCPVSECTGGGSECKCDGAGNCLGWSGTGCGGCPFGWFSSSTGKSSYCNLNGNWGTWLRPLFGWQGGEAKCRKKYWSIWCLCWKYKYYDWRMYPSL